METTIAMTMIRLMRMHEFVVTTLQSIKAGLPASESIFEPCLNDRNDSAHWRRHLSIRFRFSANSR